jgi:GntR family transcriptional regulator
MFAIKESDAVPIWRQIEEGMRRLIAAGSLRPGDVVPSVRELAAMLRVNPNTVARAYRWLGDHGVLLAKPGDATFVSEAPPPLKKSERSESLREAASRYAGTAMSVGASYDEAAGELQGAYEKLTRELRSRA